jgi:murein DD-endopeptidase MepM/ murein hydrolase activator NlpD
MEVTILRRRVHNKKRIQPSTQSTENNSKHTTSQLHILQPAYVLPATHLLLFLIVVIPLSVYARALSEKTPVVHTATTSITDVPVLTPLQNPTPLGNGGADIIVSDNTLLSSGPVGKDEIAEANTSTDEIRVYTVREGDSLSQIAEMFGVTANTIKWANDLTKSTEIQPGDTLLILPIAGVRHVIKKGDTITSLAKQYESDSAEILSYNQLSSNEDLIVGNTLIIPGGEMHAAPTQTPTKPAKGKTANGGGFINPAPGAIRTQGIHGYNGVDLAGATGSPIKAAAAGTVIVAKASGWNGGYGSYVVIKHKNGTQTLYAHLSSLSVGVGDSVAQGQVIGGMGNTGKSTGTHLHFEVRGGKNPF